LTGSEFRLWYGIFVPPHAASERDEQRQRTGGITSDRDLSRFLLRACHDLRSSLRAIRVHTELLQREAPTGTSEFDQHLGFIVDGARRIDSLTEGLSGYSLALQIDEAAFQPTRMELAVRTALAKLDKELRNAGAEVTSGALPVVSGNLDRLVQVFDILVRNAIRYRAERPPRIHISAEKQDKEWLFTIQDNGPGIEADYLERVFQPFERLHAGNTEGAGMGLTICRVIVERHGGRIRVESEPGTGSTFVFTLPGEA
jgi:light-regulated signal transduction histidine kinase (bacteriophytochrome)